MNQNQTLIQIDQFDVNLLPELQGMKEKQLQVVKENPFVEIIDTKTYDEAKKARTTLVTARTEIQNQDKLIASKIKKFREAVSGASEELIAITKPHEEKQQSEVKRWEEIKENEKQEKIRLEEERKDNIRKSIKSIIDAALMKMNNISFETLNSLKVDFEENLYKTDVSQFEEFELDFNEKLINVKNLFSSKIKNIEELEAQRVEKIRLEEETAKLAKEKAKFEAEQKAAEEKATADREVEEKRLAKIKADQEAEIEAQRKEIAEQQEKIDLENKKIQDEKDRLAKEEADRIVAEKAEQQAKEEADRKAKEADEAKKRAKSEVARLESLKPEKQKAVEFLQSLQYSIVDPEIKDEKLKAEFIRSMERIQDAISDSISAIKNFK